MKWEKETTKITVDKDTLAEHNELSEVFVGNYSTNSKNVVTEAFLNIEKLRKIIHEWKLFKKARKIVEIEVLDFFVKNAPRDTFATNEIKTKVSASASSVNRALSNLVKKNLLIRRGRGTYSRKFSI